MTQSYDQCTTEEFYIKICETLGIKTEGLAKVTIEMEAGKPFTITTKTFVYSVDFDKVIDEIKKYKYKVEEIKE